MTRREEILRKLEDAFSRDSYSEAIADLFAGIEARLPKDEVKCKTCNDQRWLTAENKPCPKCNGRGPLAPRCDVAKNPAVVSPEKAHEPGEKAYKVKLPAPTAPPEVVTENVDRLRTLSIPSGFVVYHDTAKGAAKLDVLANLARQAEAHAAALKPLSEAEMDAVCQQWGEGLLIPEKSPRVLARMAAEAQRAKDARGTVDNTEVLQQTFEEARTFIVKRCERCDGQFAEVTSFDGEKELHHNCNGPVWDASKVQPPAAQPPLSDEERSRVVNTWLAHHPVDLDRDRQWALNNLACDVVEAQRKKMATPSR